MSKILATLEIAKQTGVKCKLSKPSLLRSELPAHLSLEENCKQISQKTSFFWFRLIACYEFKEASLPTIREA